MLEKSYTIRDVLIGIFNNFPEGRIDFNYNWLNLNSFFFKNKNNYSVLNKLPFDSESRESKEFWKAYDNLETSWLIYYVEENPFKEIINKEAIEVAYKKFVKKKFEKIELSEIEQLSLEFQKEF